MKKTAILALVVAGLGASYTASAWYLGKQTEATLNSQYSKVLESNPYIEIVERDYQRGLFESEETLTLELFKQLVETMAQVDSEQPSPITEPLRLTIRNRIQHGPFPGFSTLAAAITESEILLPEGIKQDAAKLLGDKSPYSQRTLIRFDGSGSATFSSPKLDVTLPDPQADSNKTISISWQGLEGGMDFTADMKQSSMMALAPELSIKSNDGVHVSFTDMRLEGDQQRIFDDIALLYSGSQRMSIGEVAILVPDTDKKPLIMKQLSYDIELPSDGNFIDLIARLGVGNLQFGEDAIGPVHFDYSLKHLHARSLAEISQAFMGLYTNPDFLTADSEALAAQLMPVLSEHGATILNNAPEFHIDRISFANAKGEARLAARVKLNDLNLDEAAANPFVLITKLEASGEVSLQEEMVLELLRNPPGKEAMGLAALSPEELQAQTQMISEQFEQQVALLTDQGYIIREGNLLKSNAEFKAGQLLVNGKPFMPMDLSEPMEEEPVIQ